jgi:hypothetical protein
MKDLPESIAALTLLDEWYYHSENKDKTHE